MTGQNVIDPRANRLLRGLTDEELNRIRPALEAVHLPRPTELEGANEDIRFVYFPTTGIESAMFVPTVTPQYASWSHGSRYPV